MKIRCGTNKHGRYYYTSDNATFRRNRVKTFKNLDKCLNYAATIPEIATEIDDCIMTYMIKIDHRLLKR